MGIDIRRARNRDVAGIRRVFRACYGEDYYLPGVYDLSELGAWIRDPGVLVFVAARQDGGVLGTAVLDLGVGVGRNRVGEFGRLCVHPEARGCGLGTRLMDVRLQAAEPRVDLGLAETRAAVPASTAIGLRRGFRPVGFLPSKDRFARRESSILMVRHFGDALARREPRPRVVPALAPVARQALRAMGLRDDVVVAGRATSAPPGGSAPFRVDSVDHPGRGESLAVYRDGGPVGRLTWRWSSRHRRAWLRDVRVRDDAARRALLRRTVEIAEGRDALYLQADVTAGDLGVQADLVALGFRAGAYLPAATDGPAGRRRDVARMVRVHPAADLGPIDLHPAARRMARLVLARATARATQASAVGGPGAVAGAGFEPATGGL